MTNAGGSALLVMALEGAFANGDVIAGDQAVFGRIRVRVDNLVAGASYQITTPYGIFNEIATNSGTRGINMTVDVGIDTPGVFTAALGSAIGPYLRWDTGLPIIDIAGNQYLGDPNIEHTVTGSPSGTNFFRIVGPNVGGLSVNSIETNLFSVMGMLASALPPGGGGGGGPVAPVASFTTTPASGIAPLNVTFTDTSTGLVDTWSWSFGDGSVSALQSPSHGYTTPGVYTVSLTVTGPSGTNTSSVPAAVTVTAPPSLRIESVVPGTAGGRNTFNITGASVNADIVMLWSNAQGTSSQLLRGCAILADIAAPSVLFRERTRNSTSLSRSINVGRNLRGLTMYLQAIDTGNCSKSPVFVELF